MSPTEALDALERHVKAGRLALRAALAYAWQHGCTHAGGPPWPEYDVRRVGDKWCIVRLKDSTLVSTWDNEADANAAHVRLVCTPDTL
jgi:hypothetical protein